MSIIPMINCSIWNEAIYIRQWAVNPKLISLTYLTSFLYMFHLSINNYFY